MISISAFSKPVNVEGKIILNDQKGTSVSGATVTLTDASGNLFDAVTTRINGKYIFKNVPDGSYTLNVNGYVSGGIVDLSDSYLISNYLLGLIQLTDLQLKAADVNEDGRVDWDDYTAINIDYLLYRQSYSFGKIVFIPETIMVTRNNLKSGGSSACGSSGNVDGAFEPGTKTIAQGISVDYTKGVSVAANQLIEIPIYLKDISTIGGFALSLRYPNNAFDVESLTSQVKGFNYHIENGVLRISYQDRIGTGISLDHSQPLISLILRADSDIDLADLSNILINKESHIIDANGLKIENLKMTLPSFSAIGGENKLDNIFPNPIYQTATINYKLTSTYKVKLSIYNTIGQLVTNLVDNEQVEGDYSIKFNTDLLHLRAGSYIYRLECLGAVPYTESKIMIVR